jgi:hypothetical protein
MQKEISLSGVSYMTVSASKYCNGCRERVATRSIFWHTIKDYVTVRGDDVPGYADMEAPTARIDLHYCRDCWDIITDRLPFRAERKD